MFEVARTRATAASASSWLIRSLATSFSNDFCMAATVWSADSCLRDRSTTSKPLVAATCAMPDPMIPEPMIPTRLIVMRHTVPSGNQRPEKAIPAVPHPGRHGVIWETARIPDRGIIPTGYERTLPPEAQLLVRARRRRLTRTARGRVLDLGGADAHRSLWDGARSAAEATVLDGVRDPRLARLAGDGECFDTVVSVFQLASSPDLDVTLDAIRDLLAGDGHLLFVEPAAQVGLAGRMQRLVAPSMGGVTGWRADRDIPMLLRAASLSVIDLRRHRVPTLQPWLRQVLEGVAHHALAPGAGGEATSPPGPA